MRKLWLDLRKFPWILLANALMALCWIGVFISRGGAVVCILFLPIVAAAGMSLLKKSDAIEAALLFQSGWMFPLTILWMAFLLREIEEQTVGHELLVALSLTLLVAGLMCRYLYRQWTMLRKDEKAQE
ncbi:MAG: hypothetical protein OHK0029_22030 [Armatimonadaceae bacterium]